VGESHEQKLATEPGGRETRRPPEPTAAFQYTVTGSRLTESLGSDLAETQLELPIYGWVTEERTFPRLTLVNWRLKQPDWRLVVLDDTAVLLLRSDARRVPGS